MATSPFSFLLTVTVSLLALLSSTEGRRMKALNPKIASRASPVDLTKFKVPLSNGTQSLPPPTAGLKLKVITIGRGTQNYTCAAGSTAAPVSVGAKADLFDVSPLLPLFPSSDDQSILNLLPEYLVSFDFSVIENSTIPILGHHFFDAAGVPIFDLGKVGLLKGKKIGDIIAPTTACKGANGKGHGAVDWLKLTEVPGSIDLKEAYRVETAGGKPPPSCGGGADHKIQVQYAAQYWFFG